MFRTLFAAVFLTAGLLATGCAGGKPKGQQVPAAAPPPALDRAKAMLKGYASGQQPGSEGADYPQLVDEVRKNDPAKADVLKKGLDEIQKTPGSAQAKAKELLGKL